MSITVGGSMRALILLMVALTWSSHVHAGFATAVQPTTSSSSSGGTGAVGDTGGTATSASAGSTPTSPSINPGANTGQGSQNNGAMMNALAGAGLMAACMGSKPPNWALCAMGALALAQAGADSGAAGQSGTTASTSAASSPSTATAAKATTAAATGTDGVKNPAVAAAQAAMADAGYSVTPAGVTSPDGSFAPASAFNSPSSMAAAGFDASAYDQAQKVIAKATAGASVSSMGIAEGGGAGGGGSNPNGNLPVFNFGSASRNPFKLGDDAKKKMMAGKTVNFDGEPIGVRGDDIFEMVHVAYEKRRTRNNFIENDNGAVENRMPAGVVSPYVPKQ